MIRTCKAPYPQGSAAGMPAAGPMLGGLTGAVTKVVCFALVCLPCIYVMQNQQKLAELEQADGGPVFGPKHSQLGANRRAPTQEACHSPCLPLLFSCCPECLCITKRNQPVTTCRSYIILLWLLRCASFSGPCCPSQGASPMYGKSCLQKVIESRDE